MRLETVVFIVHLVLLGIVLQFIPLITRPGIFFGATVAPDFPRSTNGRRLLRSFRWQAAIWSAIAIAMTVLLTPQHPRYGGIMPVLLLIAAIGVSFWLKFREVHQGYGTRRAELRQAELTPDENDVQGIGFWIWLPPFFAIAVLALYLHLHWNQLPNPYPVHFGAHNEPNRWAHRNRASVYMPLLMATMMNLLCVGLSWLFAHQSRKTVMRWLTIRYLQVMAYPVTFTFVLVGLLPVWPQSPIWLGILITFASIGALIYWSYRKLTSPFAADQSPEPTSDNYWKAGMFYYNPDDPAIFVAKRVGIGYTLNFANKMCWLVLAGVLLLTLFPALLVVLKGK